VGPAWPHEEWVEMFNEVWRRYRDFFYVKNMHGYELGGAARAIPSAGWTTWRHRSDFELRAWRDGCGIERGTRVYRRRRLGNAEAAASGLMGARFELDAAAGRYKISKSTAGRMKRSCTLTADGKSV